jgi:uncharacterized protein (DUF169 family)
MPQLRHDYSIFQKFNFERKPVGIKFLLNRPDGLEQTEKKASICRMFVEAQNSRPFYASKENFMCVERILLGMAEPEPIMESGQIGAKDKIYQEARANRRIYTYVPKLPKNTVRYVAFSTVDELKFEPDILVITAKPSDAEILLRALSYSTGKPLTTKITPALMCAWIFLYPYVTGELNYTVTGIGYGFRLQNKLPEGLFVISVPYDLIPMLIENLQTMEWVLPITTLSEEERPKFPGRVMEEIRREYLNG